MRPATDTVGSIGIHGTIPSEIALLSSLQRFAVRNSGGLHGTLPPEIGHLTRLNGLTVFGTAVTGTIPKAYERLQN